MIRLRRNLTYDQRVNLRKDVYQREAANAMKRAAKWGLSPECLQAMAYLTSGDPSLMPAAHESCKAEDHGGKGCMCQCHDVIPQGVHSRTLHQALYD